MSDDLIKRSDAIKAIKEYHFFINNQCKYPSEGCVEVIEDAINVPSADRPQGEWIDAEIPLESGGSMPIQVCNLCKTFYPLAYTGGGHRFCPNCGADMREREGE